MKIATWNIERLKHRHDIQKMLDEIRDCDADILVLTETDSRITPKYPYAFSTVSPLTSQSVLYADSENRVTIFSKYACIRKYDTFDSNTAICVELSTERGSLVVYGTIMGVFGNRYAGFKDEVMNQMEDIRRLTRDGKHICVVGDYNLSFSDNYYFTKFGREEVDNTFSECGISILTRSVKECVDHIALSDRFGSSSTAIYEWNRDKALSDHKGIMVEI